MARLAWWIGLIFRFVVPIIFRAIFFTLHLALTAFLAVVSGIPAATTRIANHWLLQFVLAGGDGEFDTPLYYVLKVVAFLTILAGWVVLSYITTWLISMIFQRVF